MSATVETCDRCHSAIEPAAIALGWPVAVMVGDDCEYICPECYGEGAYCAAGHVLPATDSGYCPVCAA